MINEFDPLVAGNTATANGGSDAGQATDKVPDQPAPAEPAEEPVSPANTAKTKQETDELSSDGSASAFEGTEAIDSHEGELELKRKAEILKNDPSGRTNY